ncbi:MAG TPA: GntR family transcriptional regulator [Actinotalea sp.]|nr:GntR family transcriptional regulator [Actinotalea sp.]
MDTTSHTTRYTTRDTARSGPDPRWALTPQELADSRSSRRDLVHDRLRRMVLLGVFPTRERLAEERVAEMLGVSRTPVREAFLRLHAERLLRRYADGGYFVAEPDVGDLRDLYELRIALELRGLTRSLEGFGSHDVGVLEPLRDRWRALRRDQPEPDPTFVDVDESFHMALCRSSGNVVLADTLETVNARIRPVRMHDFLTEDRIELTITQHLGIVEAVLGRDLEVAVERMRQHVGESMEVVERRAARAITQMILGRGRRR